MSNDPSQNSPGFNPPTGDSRPPGQATRRSVLGQYWRVKLGVLILAIVIGVLAVYNVLTRSSEFTPDEVSKCVVGVTDKREAGGRRFGIHNGTQKKISKIVLEITTIPDLKTHDFAVDVVVDPLKTNEFQVDFGPLKMDEFGYRVKSIR
jgi:hypothetical protein